MHYTICTQEHNNVKIYGSRSLEASTQSKGRGSFYHPSIWLQNVAPMPPPPSCTEGSNPQPTLFHQKTKKIFPRPVRHHHALRLPRNRASGVSPSILKNAIFQTVFWVSWKPSSLSVLEPVVMSPIITAGFNNQ